MNVFLATCGDGYETYGTTVYATLADAIKGCTESIITSDWQYQNSHWWEPRPKVTVNEVYGGLTVGSAQNYDHWYIREVGVIGDAQIEQNLDEVITYAEQGLSFHDNVGVAPRRDQMTSKLFAGHYIGDREGRGWLNREVKHKGIRHVCAFFEIDEAELKRRLGRDENKRKAGRNTDRKAVKGMRTNDRKNWNHQVNTLRQWEEAA